MEKQKEGIEQFVKRRSQSPGLQYQTDFLVTIATMYLHAKNQTLTIAETEHNRLTRNRRTGDGPINIKFTYLQV